MSSHGGGHAYAHGVIFPLNYQLGLLHAAADGDAAAIDLGREPVLDAVFHERLQKDCGDHDVERFRVKVLVDAQLVAAKADNFDIEIIVDELNLIAQLHKLIMFAQQAAQNLEELNDQFTSAVGIKAHQRRD